MNIYQQDFHQTPEIFRLIKAFDNAAAREHLRRHPEEVALRGWMDATPLHIAVAADNLEMVQFLVQHRVDVNASRSGSSPFPLSWARSRAVAACLLDHGARLDAGALECAVIVWTRGERLGRIEIHEGRWAVTRAVHVNVCPVWSFCIDENGDIVLPTGDDVFLVLDAVTLEPKRTIPVAAGVDVTNIHSLKSRQSYLAHGGDRHLHLLDQDFELIRSLDVEDPCSGVRLNAPATLVCTRHFNYDASRVLHSLDEELVLTKITDLEDAGHGSVKSVTLHDHGAIVTFERVVVAYRHGEGGLAESWRLPLERYPCERDWSCAALLGPDSLLVGRGRQLLLIDAHTGQVTGAATLDLAGEIRELHQDARGEYLIVRGAGLKLARLDAIRWDLQG